MVKFYFIGVDGGMGSFVRKYAREGLLPNISQLMDEGTLLDTVPSIPVDTPTNWSTLMSGASSFTHGIISFSTHLPGEQPQVGQYTRRTQESSFSKAEFLWTTMEREGLRPSVLNYPVGWPPQVHKGFVIGGMTPGGGQWRLYKPQIFSTDEPVSMENWIKGDKPSYNRINLVSAGSGPEISIDIGGQLITGEISADDQSMLLHGDAMPDNGLKLKEGEWSPWVFMVYKGERATCRLKLERLRKSSSGQQEVTVYVTQIFKVSGWAHPAGTEELICKAAGPWVEGLDTPFISDPKRAYGPTNLSPELQLEHARMHAEWFVRAAAALREHGGYDGLIMHYHLIDSINHTYLALLDRENPEYDEKKAAAVEKVYRESYQIVDSMVGGLVKGRDRLAPIIITSDHSALPCWKYVSLESALSRAGLMKYEEKGNGRFTVDLARTSVFPYHDPVHLWINLKGREKDGVVDKRDYDSVMDAAIDALYSIRDPDDNSKVIKLAMKRRSWSRGRAEERFGDILLFFNYSYSNWDGTAGSLKFDEITEDRLRNEVIEKHDVAGHHTTYLPEDFRSEFMNNSFTLFSGSQIRQGSRARPQLRDVAPTISYMVGMSAPADADGNIIYDILN